MKTISKQSNLSRQFTNHSIRATSITVLDLSKFSDRDIMSISGHKSETSIKNYTGKVSTDRRYEMSSALAASVMNTDTCMQFQVQGEIRLSQEQINELFEPMPMDSEATNELDPTAINLLNVNEEAQNIPKVVDNVLRPIENMYFTPMISNCNVTFNVHLR